MKIVVVIMTGIGFTLGVVLGLLLHLPTDSLPAQHALSSASGSRDRRSLDLPQGRTPALAYNVVPPVGLASDGEPPRSLTAGKDPIVNDSLERSNKGANASVAREGQRSRHQSGWRQGGGLSDEVNVDGDALKGHRLSGRDSVKKQTQANSHNLSENQGARKDSNDLEIQREKQNLEDELYLKSLVSGVLWTDRLTNSCPRAFRSKDTEDWRRRADQLDVVKMEDGCGRMQNRLVTFRDASKACARYRLNTDQIQGEIFSYYLAKLLNLPNLPPTALAIVDSVDKKWRTVHLDMSLAQWADSKLVVLTQYIDGLQAAHIPHDFREDHRQLHPTLSHLGTKSRGELCELVQWSDLIVFDYLTANLDRVINNMFNRQWNDQIMESPAHNLEKFQNGALVFLDNESGLFHGFRLIDKYEALHRALLDSLCVFRSSTADVIKRLATSGSVGAELRALLQKHEPLHRHLANIPQKNVKILQKRIEQVNEQISKCEKMFKS